MYSQHCVVKRKFSAQKKPLCRPSPGSG